MSQENNQEVLSEQPSPSTNNKAAPKRGRGRPPTGVKKASVSVFICSNIRIPHELCIVPQESIWTWTWTTEGKWYVRKKKEFTTENIMLKKEFHSGVSKKASSDGSKARGRPAKAAPVSPKKAAPPGYN
jgi:hypothetical protein